MAQKDGPSSSRNHGDPLAHRTTTVEKGPFCTAQCSCGWRGPARRARSLARTDAEGHVSG
ncbi:MULTISPECIES: hypothetical protein [unclassified Streptomyces]|uniref:hypothetical protein n=1 Tax=Streptomyces sp. T21Q-yed TaxID=3018441 RepID=UPI0023667EA2|nr:MULTISPECIES: hypothetical protein [unclassified Streptomyces]MDF3146068.1 hypothetical protein [Streptomyces sp. T21Q-yed]WDF39329.1 hypothetical protein PBV52_22235 [Streptomyces sp. T12]